MEGTDGCKLIFRDREDCNQQSIKRLRLMPRLISAILSLGAVAAVHWAEVAIAQDQDLDLDVLKKDLIDATAGFYVSPILSLGYAAGDAEVDNVADIEFNGPIVRGGLSVGYQVEFLRTELEVAAAYLDLNVDVDAEDGINVNALDINDKQRAKYFKISANSLVDFPYDLAELVPYDLPETIPYAGFGLGGILVDFEDGDTDEGLLVEGLAGLGIRLSPRWFVDAGYRLSYTPSIESDGLDLEVLLHSAEAKLRYRF
ncbi:MAG: outer membrane protein [Geminicoccaceae bacterium]